MLILPQQIRLKKVPTTFLVKSIVFDNLKKHRGCQIVNFLPNILVFGQIAPDYFFCSGMDQ